MSLTDAELGREFQQWATRVIGIFAYRQVLENHRDVHRDPSPLIFSTEAADRNENEDPVRLDVRAGSSESPPVLIGEIKWTRVDPTEMLRKALGYIYQMKGEPHRVVVVGAPEELLKGLTDEDVLSEGTKAAKHSLKVVYAFRDKNGGTGVLDFRTDSRRLTVVLISYNEKRRYDFAHALAILLTRPAQKSADHDLDLLALAKSCMDPAIRQILDPPSRAKERLNLTDVLARKLPPPLFVLDPWSFLAQKYLQEQSQRTPKKYRWIRLLYDALSIRATGNEGALLAQDAVAAKIAPLPLRCGRGPGVVHYLESVIEKPLDGVHDRKPEVRLVVGTAGTGKSTLLEFLFNNHVDRLRRGSGASHSSGLPVFIDLQRDSEALTELSSPPGEDSVKDQRALSRVLERLIGTTLIERDGGSLANDAEATPRATGLDALLLHFQLYLYVDGYDQLAAVNQDLLRHFGILLRNHGYDPVFLLLSSRPGFDERLAFDWKHTFVGLQSSPSPESILSLAPPELDDLLDYCGGWLAELRRVIGAPSSTEQEGRKEANMFFAWIGERETARVAQPDRADEDGDRRLRDVSATAILKNPLLMAMSLAIYMLRYQKESFDFPSIIRTAADLFEALITELPRPDHALNEREGGSRGGLTQLSASQWRQWFERSCFLELCQKGRTVGRVSLARLENEWDIEGRDLDRKDLNLPFLQQLQEGDEWIEFVHPSFHEFLASSFLARSLDKGSVPSRRDAATIPYRESVALQVQDRIAGTEFGRIVVAMGRDSFKYLLGQLLRLARDFVNHRKVNGIKRLSELLTLDYGLQQYLYDSGYVERSVEELEASVVPVGWARSRAVRKMIGHTYYGRGDGLVQGVAEMVAVVHEVPSDGISLLHRWIGIFCIDHIENRLDRVSPEAVHQVLGQMDFIVPFDRRTDLATWVQDNWELYVRGMGIFKAIPTGGPARPSARSLAAVPEPDWSRELPFVLRAAHYWGHVGNRILRQEGKTAGDPTGARIIALEAYARAIVYRLVALFLTVGRDYEIRIRDRIGNDVEFPGWFARWVERGGSEPAMESTRSGQDEIAGFERFVGPAQAIADTANQFSCQASLFLWEWAQLTTPEAKKQAFDLAEHSYTTSKSLWELARNDYTRGLQGEEMIRYFLHLAGVDVRLEIARRRIQGEKDWTPQETRERTSNCLITYQREYGMSYELATQDVMDSTLAFRDAVAEGGETPP